MIRVSLIVLMTAGTAAAAPSFEATRSVARGNPIAGVAARASSTLCEGAGSAQVCHPPSNLLDEDRATAWCEGAKGSGAGEWIALSLPSPVELRALSIVPFYAKDFRRAIANARPARILVEHDTGRFELTLDDFPARVGRENRERASSGGEGPCGDETCMSRDDRIRTDGTFSINFGDEGAPPPPLTGFIRLTIVAAHAGTRAQDLCISSVRLFAK